MKANVIAAAVLLLFCAAVQAQERAACEGSFEKPPVAGQSLFVPPGIPARAVAGESQKVSLLSCYVLDQDYDEKSFNWIKISEVKGINLQVYLMGLTTTSVRFRFLVTGPQFYEHTSSWYAAPYGTAKWVWNFVPKAKLNKKGLYKLVVVAETKGGSSGEGCVASSTFRIF